ncbi:MAG: ORF6N domain protein [Candidatus Udaeobacter sp.]|nr:MAG: ORF6N domain protein [Candidatus Udaeobacter sp.]
MSKAVIPIERIASAILMLRDQRVMLDYDLAVLYGVETRALKQAVRRNPDRFPNDFMFELSEQEIDTVVSQFVIPDRRRFGGAKPMAFTEQGIAMLSSVLNNERAIKVNIAIMRAFVKLRQVLDTNRELAQKFSELEQRVGKHDEEIAAILEAIRQLMAPPEKARREIGFHVREKAPRYRVRKRA